jgi:tripartite-type tricarboxylate transporter receptor subunit TctC
LPDAPLLSETVMPGLEVGNWYAVMAPAQTPPAIVSRLNGEIVKALQDAGLRSRMEEQGADPRSSTPGEYGAYMKSEFERWTKVVKTGGLKVE